jgi:hypothetical protein
MTSWKQMRERWVVGLAVAGALVWGGNAASAAVLTFEANLDPFQEVPPHNTPAYGDATLTLDTTTDLVTVTAGNYADLLGGTIAVSLNGLAAPGANGAVLISLTLDNPGTTTGTFSGSGTLADDPTANGMIMGNTYINIRDSVFPSGEIRGQVTQTPEPSTLVLASLAALALAACARRRRQI